jgi:hypothetical protein
LTRACSSDSLHARARSSCVAARILNDSHADPQTIEREVVEQLAAAPPRPRGQAAGHRAFAAARVPRPVSGAVPWRQTATPASFADWLGRALRAAGAIAAGAGRPVDVADFLVALARDRESQAGWALAELGVDLSALRAAIEEVRELDRELERLGREQAAAIEAGKPARAAELAGARQALRNRRSRRADPPEGDDAESVG